MKKIIAKPESDQPGEKLCLSGTLVFLMEVLSGRQLVIRMLKFFIKHVSGTNCIFGCSES